MTLEIVLKPIAAARGLPNAHYISAEHYEAERREIFFAGWSALAFECDVPEPGDAFPVDFCGMPCLLIRTRSGEIKVFQNTCRHRGMILVNEPTHLKGPIRCPYHSWCYDHDGALVRTPYVGGVDKDEHEAIDKSELGLFQIRHHVWQGVVFVNVSGDAPPFDEAHADLVKRWSEFDVPYFMCGEESQFEMLLDTNWKLAVENYCEAYHLPWVHPELNQISKLEDHYNIENHENYAGQGSLVYNQLVGDDGSRFPDFDGPSKRWNTLSEYISVFPNVLMGVHRDHAFSMILMPRGPEKTLERVALFYADADVADWKWEPMRKRNAEIWQGVFAEDVGVVEGMQRGRHGVLFDGGKFSPVMDVPTHIFHKWVAKQLAEPELGPAK